MYIPRKVEHRQEGQLELMSHRLEKLAGVLVRWLRCSEEHFLTLLSRVPSNELRERSYSRPEIAFRTNYKLLFAVFPLFLGVRMHWLLFVVMGDNCEKESFEMNESCLGAQENSLKLHFKIAVGLQETRNFAFSVMFDL